MAHAHPARRAFTPTANHIATAALAAVVFAGIVLFSTLGMGIRVPVAEPSAFDQALMQSARQWELERRQQAGYVDPLSESGDRWELERRQQGLTPS